MNRSRVRLTTTCIVALFAILPATGSAGEVETPAVSLTLEQRVACAEKVADVYWDHRIWPDANTNPKPDRSEVVPRSQVAAGVEKSLVQEAVLEHLQGEPLTSRQVQRELDRMARSTQHPRLLADVFDALGNDPTLIAECYVRPRLVERLLHQAYAWDPELHRGLRDRATDELSQVGSLSDLGRTSAVVTETTWVRVDGFPPDTGLADDEVALEPNEWSAATRRLAARFPMEIPDEPGEPGLTDPTELLARQVGLGVSPLFETARGFAVVEVLEARNGRLRVAAATWPKRGVDDWLKTLSDSLAPANPAGGSYVLPQLKAWQPCVDDTWTPTVGSGSPSARQSHTMVWTGTEVIAWGGTDNTLLGDGGRYDPATDTWVPMSSTGAPTPRHSAAAVWTGLEVVVWGGYDGSPVNTGSRYNPVTDTWTPTSTVNAPSGRMYIDAVWTGTEMIVWGGYYTTNTGGRYDPSTDTWTTMTTTNAPSARANHAVVWTGTEMIVWGGEQSGPLDTGGRYDPSTDTWTAMSTVGAPSPRRNLSGVWTGTEVIVWGGDASGPVLDTGGRYDPATDSWLATTMVDAPTARTNHSAVWTGTAMVVWGGVDSPTEYNTGGRYDPATDTWTATSTTGAAIPRTNHQAVWTGTEMIVWGGFTGSPTDTGGRYDPVTDTWVAMSPNMPSARTKHTAVWTGAEMIIWGGQDDSPYTNNGSRYDPASDSWAATSIVDAPDARDRHRAVWTGTEMIVWGGWAGDYPEYYNTGGRYNPATDSWTATATSGAPVGRYDHAAVWTGTEMIVWGGTVSSASALTGGRYNPATDSWTATSTVGAPDSTNDTVAVWTGSRMLVWGGYSATDEGGRYDPVSDSWTPISMIGVPEARQWHTGVWTGSEFIVWGGYTGYAHLDSGGRYNPATDTWVATSTSSAPTGRRLPGSVWTGTEMIVWGGHDDIGRQNTGGRYDPATDSWTPTTTTGAPRPRFLHTSVWTGTEMIVWGGDMSPWKTNTGGRYCASSVIGVDFGDAPDPTYPTLLASDGARHSFDGLFHLGASVDGETDGQPTAAADGDDLDGTDDEDGVVFTSGLGRGVDAAVEVTASGSGLLNAFVDFNADGDWIDPGEQVFTDQAVVAGPNSLSFAVPLAATLGPTFARFRLSSSSGLGPTGHATDGEVEDYRVEIVEGPDLAVEMTASPEPVPSGYPLTYTLTVTNHGPLTATSVSATDTLPGTVTFISSTPGAPDCSFGAGTLTCDLGTMEPTGTAQITIETVLHHPVWGSVSNAASVSAAEVDPVTANNTATVDTRIALFVDGFENGTTDGWSSSVP